MYRGLLAVAVGASPLLAVTLFLGSGAADRPAPLAACAEEPVGDQQPAPSKPSACPSGSGSGTALDLEGEQCTVRPDPTTGRGCLTPRTAALALELVSRRWAISCWDEHAWNPRSDHPRGRACDVFPGRPGLRPTAAERARGDALAAGLQASSAVTGVDYVIWSGRIWSSRHGAAGWRPYTGGGIYDPTDVVGGHYDHLHISVGP